MHLFACKARPRCSSIEVRPISIRQQIDRGRTYVGSGGLGPFLIRAFAGSGAVQAVGMVFTFLVGIQLARGLGVEGYGFYGIAMAVIALAAIPAEFGLPKLVTREVAGASQREDWPLLIGVLRWSDRTCLGFSLAAAVATGVGAMAFLDAQSSPIALAIAAGLPIIPLFALARIRGAALQGLNFIVLGQAPALVLRPLLLSIFLYLLFQFVDGAGAAEAMAINSLTAAAALAVAHMWLRTRLPPRPSSKPVSQGRKWLSSALPIGLADAVHILNAQVAILLLGLLATSEAVGLFRIAVSITAVLGLPTVLTTSVISPTIARLHAQLDRGRLQTLCTRAAQATSAGTILLSLPVLVWGPDLIAWLFGAEFAAAYPALAIMIASLVINALFGPNAILLTMTGHERRVTRAMATGLVVAIGLMLALVPAYGIVGAAIALFAWMLVWNLIAWLDSRRLLGLETTLFPVAKARTSPHDAPLSVTKDRR